MLKGYIKEKYDNNADRVIRYVAYKRYLPYFEQKCGSTSKEVQQYRSWHKRLVVDIEKQYGSKVYQNGSKDDGVGVVDEGYVSG